MITFDTTNIIMVGNDTHPQRSRKKHGKMDVQGMNILVGSIIRVKHFIERSSNHAEEEK